MAATPFGRAMLDEIESGQRKQFTMEERGGHSLRMNCSDFLGLRDEEREILRDLQLPDAAHILDYGCGAGRYLQHISENLNPNASLVGIEPCDLLREHCRGCLGPEATLVSSYAELANQDSDLILLVGNGLGVLGREESAREGLASLVSRLRPGGRLLVESGNPFGAGYAAREFRIRYGNQTDDWFWWGFSDEAWLRHTLSELGCSVRRIIQSAAPGGCFFFILAQRAYPPQAAQAERDLA